MISFHSKVRDALFDRAAKKVRAIAHCNVSEICREQVRRPVADRVANQLPDVFMFPAGSYSNDIFEPLIFYWVGDNMKDCNAQIRHEARNQLRSALFVGNNDKLWPAVHATISRRMGGNAASSIAFDIHESVLIDSVFELWGSR